jgi:hypothetical protein
MHFPKGKARGFRWFSRLANGQKKDHSFKTVDNQGAPFVVYFNGVLFIFAQSGFPAICRDPRLRSVASNRRSSPPRPVCIAVHTQTAGKGLAWSDCFPWLCRYNRFLDTAPTPVKLTTFSAHRLRTDCSGHLFVHPYSSLGNFEPTLVHSTIHSIPLATDRLISTRARNSAVSHVTFRLSYLSDPLPFSCSVDPLLVYSPFRTAFPSHFLLEPSRPGSFSLFRPESSHPSCAALGLECNYKAAPNLNLCSWSLQHS